ncbi:uncharacterized protein LOC142612412 [Castanea sativa]|uniref:uncharacterized protein LOC142612412 n=1 Tax=Castanea sativa TaxID=21020 RepID=UPI003F64DC5A
MGIRNGYSTPSYPQGNGQAEATNKVILAGLKKRLDDAKGGWVEELPHVLWAYRTTPRRSTGETPFSMTYGMEVIIPLESGFPTLKSDQYDEASNHERMYDCLNTIEERREVANVKMGSYQQKLKQTYDKGVRSRPLVPANSPSVTSSTGLAGGEGSFVTGASEGTEAGVGTSGSFVGVGGVGAKRNAGG